jgi:RNA polymerase sigma-70 factor, ECF subfamily
MSKPPEVTRILDEMAGGDRRREPELLESVYTELHRLAAGYMRNERGAHTLRASALINEAYLRLFRGNEPVKWESRTHFYVTAAQVMRRILIDHARSHAAEKRGGEGAVRVELTDAFGEVDNKPGYFLGLDRALQKLEEMDPRLTKVVELRFFVGLTVEETAQALNISPKTVKRDWALARVWLEKELASLET